MSREIRYWNPRQFFRIYGRDPSAKGFPRRDGEGCYLTKGYRIRLDAGQPETGEPSPMPSRSTAAIAEPILEAAAAGRATAHAPGARVSFRHFEHSGGFDGFEGRMVQRPDGPGRRSRSR